MKKFPALMMAAVIIFLLAGCSVRNAKIIFEEAAKKTLDLKDMDITTSTAVTITQGKRTVDTLTGLDNRITGFNTKDVKYLAAGKTTIAGKNSDILMYYDDGYYYLNTMGKKIKYKIDINQLAKQIKQSTAGANLQPSFLKKITAGKDKSGIHLTFTADAEKTDEYVQNIVSSLKGTVAGLEGVTCNIREISGEALVNKDGYFSSMKVKICLDMGIRGKAVGVEINSDADYNNQGRSAALTTPDLDGYKEVAPAAAGVQK